MRRLSPTLIYIVILVVLGITAYATSLNNQALFHHTPDPYRDPVLDNSMLNSRPLLGKVLTGEFLVSTYGEYRPLGYALFALVSPLIPHNVYWPWHLLLLGMHLVIAGLILAVLRMLVQDIVAWGLAAAYMVHPMLAPLINDINYIYLLWGLLFSVITVWLYLIYLNRRRSWYLLLSVLAFVAATFTYEYALVVPALLIALCLLYEAWPQVTAAVLVYVALGGYATVVLGYSMWAAIGALAMAVVILSVALRTPWPRYRALVWTLPPYFAVLGVFMAVAASIQPVRMIQVEFLGDLKAFGLDQPFRPWAVGQTTLFGSPVNIVSVMVATLLPGLLLLRKRFIHLAIIISLGFLLFATVRWNPNYRDDTTYWERLNKAYPNRVPLQFQLAEVYLHQQHWQEALDILMGIKYEANIPHQFHDIVSIKVGRAFAGLGKDKVAGYFFLLPGGTPVFVGTKHCLMEKGEFWFHLGYPSTGENCWASALVYDPYDVRLYNSLGRGLVYKNFFKAAAKHFRHTLSLQPNNPTALYYLAFISQLRGADKDYERYCQRWQAVTNSNGQVSFQPIYDRYNFQRDKTRSWFGGDPLTLSWYTREASRAQDNPYVVVAGTETHKLAEVPLEIGKYFIRQGNYRAAVRHLLTSYQTDAKLREPVELLAEVYRHLNDLSEANHYQRLLEMMPDGTD